MRKFLFFTLALVVAWTAAMAVPAKPGIHTVTLPDGSTLQVSLAGDEWHHSFVTVDGYTIQQADDGFFYYVTVDGLSKTRVNNVDQRSMDEKAFIEANRELMTMNALYNAKMRDGKLKGKTPRGVNIKAADLPTSGSPRVPVLLVQYTDKSMSNTKAQFEAHYKTNSKSVYQYFVDQSFGSYTPQYDIYGIYTLPSTRATYGGNNSNGDDKGVAKMVGDAISRAGNNINWAQYDNDGDGYVDACIVVYAGPGEASGANSNTIWPCQWYLSAGGQNGDGSGAVTRNGVTIDKFAVFCETRGSSDNGTTLDGIGTFCHEFSHCLGLPDFYCTDYSNHFGMGDWSLLCQGCNNDDGDTPCSYTAYERNFMGWMNLSTPEENTTYTIPTVDAGGQAFKITSNNANEYYIVENIQKTGWNQYARSSGLMVTHVNYNATRWNNNTLNNYDAQGMTIIPADNSLLMNYYSGYGYYVVESDEAGDLYPYNGNNELTSTSTPAATLYNSSANLDKPITGITKNSGGTVSFTYMAAPEPATGGSASDAYLDIANYETIDEAGWNSTYVYKPYKYTEYQSQQIGWLTMSVFGAWAAWRYTANGVEYPQKWITSNFTSATTSGSATVTQTTWSYTPTYTNPFNGSSAYFSTTTGNGRPRGVGNLNAAQNSSARRSVTFYVTNTTAVKLYGKNNRYANSGYAAKLSIYECELSADGTPTPASNPVKDLSNYDTSGGTSGTEFTIEATGLDDTKIYMVETSIVRGTLFEIAFQTPLNKPKLTASPKSLTFMGQPGETVTKSFTVTGKNLTGDITATITGANGSFSVPATISASDAMASEGATVDVTFTAPENLGTYNGTLTLASTGLTATVDLKGYSGVSQVTLTAEDVWGDGTGYQMLLDIDHNAYGNIIPETGGLTASGNASAAVYAEFEYKIPENADGSLTTTHIVTNNNSVTIQIPAGTYDWVITNPTPEDRIWIASANGNVGGRYDDYVFEAGKTYEFVVSRDGSNDRVDVNLAGLPINVVADPGSTTAVITWTPGNNNDGWNLRWRPWVDVLSINRFWDFPVVDGYVQTDGWYSIDGDEDGNEWGLMATDGDDNTDPTDACWASQSYINSVGAVTPDNWLVSPAVKLGGTLKFKAWRTQYEGERLGVFIYQDGYENLVQVGQDILPTETETVYSFDLSSFEGTGLIIIRHYNCTDGFYVFVDDIEVRVPDALEEVPQEYEWNYVYDVTSPYTITGLTPETIYEVQVQGVNAFGAGNWTASTLFTTLPLEEAVEATLATIEGSGVEQAVYTISDELVVVYADKDYGLLWCKDQGNVSINPSSILDGQIDFMNDANLTGTTGQCGRDWDQSNWVALKFPADQNTSSVLTGAVGKKIKAGTVTGRYIDNNNYTIEVLPVDGNYTLTFNGTLEYTPNVYCCANFVESNLNIGGNTGAVGPHGDHYFFMNPKVQEICEITYAMWNGEMFVTPNNTSIQGAFHVDWSRNSIGAPTLQEGKTYRFIAIVSRPAKLSDLKGGGTPSDNYVVYPTNLSGDSNIVTAINGVYTDSNRDVVGVEYVNAAGIVSKTPFHGVNIVVTRYSDGSKTTSKKIFK